MLAATIAATVAITGALLGGPGAPAPAALLAPAQVDCTKWPYGTYGCEEYLGGKVRLKMPNLSRYVSNTDLGLATMALCEHSAMPGDLRGAGVPATLAYQVSIIGLQKTVVPFFCS